MQTSKNLKAFNLVLRRTHLQENRTFGVLHHPDGTRLCYTLEDTVREKPGQPVASWKVHGKTAIGAGTYHITLEDSPRFGPDTLTVNAVKGFTGVRMHAGNTEGDTEGCPLLGMATTETGIVGGTSRPAVAKVKQVVAEAIARGEIVTMRIVNPPMEA